MTETQAALPRQRVKVARVEKLTDRIKMFELVGDGTALLPFDAGSHVEIATGAGVARNYSLSNDPAETHRYVIAVQREPQGRGSGWMHEQVSVGDTLELAGPRNAFPLQEDASEHILITGGVGITPIRAMAHRLDTIGARFRVYYCTRAPEDTAFHAELLDRFGERFLMHHDGGDLTRALDMRSLLRERPEGAHVYVCGPAGMVKAVREATSHWPPDTVHMEVFASPAQTPQVVHAVEAEASGDQPFEVELARSGKRFTIPADRSILDVLLEAGIKAPYVCKEGWCGNCQTRLISGRADHRDDVLDDDEKEANKLIQVCISRALPGETLVLDR